MWAIAALAVTVGGAATLQTGLPASPVAPIGLEARFAQRPSAGDYAAVYPHAAVNVGMPGHVGLDCGVASSGWLDNCKVVSEFPEGVGFGASGLSLARHFRLDPESTATHGGHLSFAIGFATVTEEDAQLTFGPWLAAPSFADVGTAYPDIGGGVTGQVFLHCGLAHDGRLKDCKALYQRPSDREFDAAALKLAHLFEMKIDPAVQKSRLPLSANVLVRIAAPFEDEAKQRRIGDPIWLAAPSAADLSRLFPAPAAAKGIVAGVGVVDCTVAEDGTLANCQADGQGDPPDLGFADAALKAASAMRMSPWTDDGGPVDGARIRLPIRFTSASR